jgi:hypothetical protein
LNVVRLYAGDVDQIALASLSELPANAWWPPETVAPVSRKKRRAG